MGRQSINNILVFLLGMIMYLLFLSPLAAQAVSPEWTGNTAANFAGGTGTEQNPYLISTGEQLAYFSQQVNGGNNYANKYIRLTQDILLNDMNSNGTFKSASPKPFISIGDSSNKPFKGIFDGGGFKIIGLYINTGWIEYRGLFGYAGTGSVIKDLKISGSIAGKHRTGSVAGYTNGIITGCIVSSKVTSTGGENYRGGIAGYAGVNSIISNCTASGTVAGQNNVGGIVGYTEGKVTECSYNNAVTGVTNIGGIAGYAAGTGTEISDCEFSGTVFGNSECVGGIAGKVEGLITRCTVNATIQGNSATIGGITGYAAGAASTITNCNIAGTVKATGGYGYVGGVAGKADGKITGCVSGCSVIGTGQHFVGGIVGTAGTGSEVSNSSSSGSITGIGKVGGIAGYTDGEIKICINTGSVNGGGSGYTGGVAGEAGNNSTVSNSFNSGAVDGGNKGPGGIGGIVGYVSPNTIVHHNLNRGTVEGNQLVGSVIGNSINEDNAWNNYYYDYAGAPGGTTSGDITDDDGAVPIGDLTWEEIRDLLNENNDEGDDVWNQDVDDNGVPKPSPGSAFKIINSVIKEGKYYSAALLGSNTSVAITSDSVFTVFFGTRYNSSCEPEEQTIRLKGNDAALQLPAGTSIIMLTNGSYYYINLTAAAGVITLGEFLRMGSTTEHYESLPTAENDEKQYLFIIDFSKTALGNQIPTGSYNVELLSPSANYPGTPPVVTVAGKNNYSLSATGNTNMFTVNFTKNSVSGYDYKTDGKIFAYEFYLENNGIRVPFPIGTIINGKVVASQLPYTFAATPFQNLSFALDMSGCAVPLTSGNYNLHIKAYASADILNPRNGYSLANSTTNVSLNIPAIYAIKVNGGTIVYNRSESDIPVDLTVRTLGTGNVKATLQRKYGKSYVNIEGQENKPVTITGERTTVHVPAGSPKGTYRFVLSIYDENGTQKVKDVQNIIIK